MATHTFVCDRDGTVVADATSKGVHICPQCQSEMRWAINFNTSGSDQYRHVSDSLAFHPDDISEHRRLFPDVEVTPEGQPVFNSVKQQEKYAEKAGFYKKPQKLRSGRLGRVRIA